MVEVERLARREREVAEAVYALGEASAGEIASCLSDPLSNSAVRSMLGRLEAKGVLRHRRKGRKFYYRPAASECPLTPTTGTWTPTDGTCANPQGTLDVTSGAGALYTGSLAGTYAPGASVGGSFAAAQGYVFQGNAGPFSHTYWVTGAPCQLQNNPLVELNAVCASWNTKFTNPVDGIDPWVIDVGPDPLDVTMSQMPSDWAVTTSGCTDPLVTLIEAGDIPPAAATGLACAGGEAFLTYSSVFMQPGPVDGGGMLLTNSDEGWGSSGGGTSFSCSDWLDGVDRCGQFGVEDGGEMFQATSPLPPPELIEPQTDFVMVREVTDEVSAMGTGAADLDAMVDAIVAGTTAPAEAEVEPTVTRHDGISFERYTLLVIDVPLLDDSTRSTTWAVWITTPTAENPPVVHKAYTWNNCARGVADGVCV